MHVGIDGSIAEVTAVPLRTLRWVLAGIAGLNAAAIGALVWWRLRRRRSGG
jgi:hypothetical protein